MVNHPTKSLSVIELLIVTLMYTNCSQLQQMKCSCSQIQWELCGRNLFSVVDQRRSSPH